MYMNIQIYTEGLGGGWWNEAPIHTDAPTVSESAIVWKGSKGSAGEKETRRMELSLIKV